MQRQRKLSNTISGKEVSWDERQPGVLFQVIESKQRGECFDCGGVRKVYGVQKVICLNQKVKWEPTCKGCAQEHLDERLKVSAVA
jgi:hypothetical protein